MSLQVFEYLDDLPAACVEALRALRSGGRLVVSDVHFDSLVWFTEDQPRMDRMLAAWDAHYVERGVPAILPGILRNAGFVVERIEPATFLDHDLKPDGLAKMMLHLMEGYAIQNGPVPADVAQAWRAEQEDLASQGRFFFSLTVFSVVASKP